jgi:hypothetical protein
MPGIAPSLAAERSAHGAPRVADRKCSKPEPSEQSTPPAVAEPASREKAQRQHGRSNGTHTSEVSSVDSVPPREIPRKKQTPTTRPNNKTSRPKPDRRRVKTGRLRPPALERIKPSARSRVDVALRRPRPKIRDTPSGRPGLRRPGPRSGRGRRGSARCIPRRQWSGPAPPTARSKRRCWSCARRRWRYRPRAG